MPYIDPEEPGTCDECGSTFIRTPLAMSGLCRECAYWIYGKTRCNHSIQGGACTQCGWDGSVSEYVLHIKLRGDSHRDPSVPADRPTSSIADLFDPEPGQWGLRGDPYLWREMKKMFSGVPLPQTETELRDTILIAFQALVGMRIEDGQNRCFIERFSQGGMSSGQISLEFWPNKALSILGLRYANAHGLERLADLHDTDEEQSDVRDPPS
ncbi:MAG: hypothetical protein JNL58_00200 [Planctomyces sp.]|nr:hypothetical protein [Planctomyces sp.]